MANYPRTDRTLRQILDEIIKLIQEDIKRKGFNFTGRTSRNVSRGENPRGPVKLFLPQTLNWITQGVGRAPGGVVNSLYGILWGSGWGSFRGLTRRETWATAYRIVTSGTAVYRGSRLGVETDQIIESTVDNNFKTVADNVFLDTLDNADLDADTNL